MLNNHLTSYRRGCSLFFMAITLSSCAIKPINKNKGDHTPQETIDHSACSSPDRGVDSRILVSAAKQKSQDLSFCFINYLKFETNKKQHISTCNQLVVRKNGDVSYVQISPLGSKALPKDLSMCLTQEYKRMNFQGLQLKDEQLVRFSIDYKSI